MKDIFKGFMLASTFLTLVACGNDDPTSTEEPLVEESNQITDTESSMSSEIAPESSSEASIESESSTDGAMTGTFMHELAKQMMADSYMMEYNVTSTNPDLAEIGSYTQTIAYKDEMMAMTNEVNGVTSRTLVRDDKIYMIDDTAKQIMVADVAMEAEDTTINADNPIDIEGFTFIESGSEGDLSWEKYQMEMVTSTYYFSGNDLERIEIDDGTFVTTLEVSDTKTNPPPDMFHIPEGYMEINLNDFNLESQE